MAWRGHKTNFGNTSDSIVYAIPLPELVNRVKLAKFGMAHNKACLHSSNAQEKHFFNADGQLVLANW